MLQQLPAAIGVAGVLFVLVASAAIAVAWARASFAKAQIEALRGDVQDWSARSDRFEREAQEEKTQRIALEHKVHDLQEMVQGIEQLEHLQTTVETGFRSIETWQAEQRRLTREVTRMLGGRREDDTGGKR